MRNLIAFFRRFRVFLIFIALQVIALSTYFFVYSFFGIAFYEGFNTFNMLPGIAQDISYIGADLKAADTCVEPSEFYFDQIPRYVYNFCKGVVKYLFAYMFELILIFILLIGISVYVLNYGPSIASKINTASFTSASMSVGSAFQNLFTWLIMINIVLIVLICIFMYQKFRQIQALQVNTNFKETEKTSTTSGPMPGQGFAQGPFQGPFQGSGQGPFQEPFQGPLQGPFQGSVQEPFQGPFQGPFQEPFQGPLQGSVQEPFQRQINEPMNELLLNQLPIDPLSLPLQREQYVDPRFQPNRPMDTETYPSVPVAI